MEKISRKNWALIWVLGMAGQICWNIENSWFNTFVYRKIAPDPSIVAWMVGVSAVVSTFCTFLIGTASDRLGRRRPFIAFGYILWGVFTIGLRRHGVPAERSAVARGHLRGAGGRGDELFRQHGQ